MSIRADVTEVDLQMGRHFGLPLQGHVVPTRSPSSVLQAWSLQLFAAVVTLATANLGLSSDLVTLQCPAQKLSKLKRKKD